MRGSVKGGLFLFGLLWFHGGGGRFQFGEMTIYKGADFSLFWSVSALLFLSLSKMASAVYARLLGLPVPLEDAVEAADEKRKKE